MSNNNCFLFYPKFIRILTIILFSIITFLSIIVVAYNFNIISVPIGIVVILITGLICYWTNKVKFIVNKEEVIYQLNQKTR